MLDSEAGGGGGGRGEGTRATRWSSSRWELAYSQHCLLPPPLSRLYKQDSQSWRGESIHHLLLGLPTADLPPARLSLKRALTHLAGLGVG